MWGSSGSIEKDYLAVSKKRQKFEPTPELDVSFTLNLYPGLTDSGRLRGDSDLRFRWELYRDLFWDVTAWGVYDNQSIGDGNFDYGVSTGIGWDY